MLMKNDLAGQNQTDEAATTSRSSRRASKAAVSAGTHAKPY